MLSQTNVVATTPFTFSTTIRNTLGTPVSDLVVTFSLSTDQIIGNGDEFVVGSVTLPTVGNRVPTAVNAELSIPRNTPNNGPYWLVWELSLIHI